jgi:hypothetical protein
MRRLLYSAAAGLVLAGLSYGLEPPGKPARPVESSQPSPFVEKEKGDAVVCHDHGTKVDFVDSPKEAAALAKKQEKLVFVLHVSGNFEDPRFT